MWADRVAGVIEANKCECLQISDFVVDANASFFFAYLELQAKK